MSESKSLGQPENSKELRSLALTPTWSVASVLTIFVAVSLLVERTIHSLCNWLKKTDRKPLLAAVEKMKEELMLLGFISLLLPATSSIISNICIPSKFYNSAFAPCTMQEVDEERENKDIEESSNNPHSRTRVFNGLNQNTCRKNYEPFVSFEGLEQLHRFIFVMAITHISYSCLTMLLAIVKKSQVQKQCKGNLPFLGFIHQLLWPGIASSFGRPVSFGSLGVQWSEQITFHSAKDSSQITTLLQNMIFTAIWFAPWKKNFNV